MAMESKDKLSAICLDVINAFGEIERDYIKASLPVRDVVRAEEWGIVVL
jgi:hypothetical protein